MVNEKRNTNAELAKPSGFARFGYNLGSSIFITLFFFVTGNLLPGVIGLWFPSNLLEGLFIICFLEFLTMFLVKGITNNSKSYFFLVLTKRALLFGFIVDGFKVGS